MIEAGLPSPLRARWGAALLALLLHLVAIVVLVRAFAPDLAASIVRPAVHAFDVAINRPPVPPVPSPKQASSPSRSGAAAPAGRKAVPRPMTAPRPEIVLTSTIAPPIAGTGAADTSGASTAGQGTGAGGQGAGVGSGGAGTGTGGGATKPVKVAGDIVSARDYPRSTRDLRLGSAVTLALTVATDGRVGGCKVVRPSRDPEADRITCRLATERFRFRPATDDAGKAVTAIYGWQQRWFAP